MIPPLAVTAPAPEIVLLLSVNSPPTATSPAPVSVPPPLIVRAPPIVDAAAIESAPPEIVSGSVDVRLLMESVTLAE